ncbi:hypothetical protein AAC387_Pa03g0411 [Persea americana]
MQNYVDPAKPRILLAASGSVAASKFANLCHSFSEWAEIRAVATKSALHFIDKESLPKDVLFYTDDDEWSSWKKIRENVLHIELRKWADLMVIAPLSADTLGKLSSPSSLSKISARNCSRLTISGIDYVIQHCSNLLSLSISINPISSSHAFIESFRANASNLQSLAKTRVSDELLCVIGNHNLVLVKLVLSSSHGFTFDGRSAVVLGQQSLQHLDLFATDFLTDEMMSSLSVHLPHVFSIGLKYCIPLTSSTLFNLAKNCPSLEEISMSYTSLGLGGEDLVSELGKNCKILSLKLRNNENLRDETLERIGTLCPELSSLDVSRCWSITGVGIGGIGKHCTKITELRIDRCRKVRNLGSDLQFSKLEVLMASASGIEDEGLEMIGRGCQRLWILHVEDCRGVTKEGLRQ